MRLEELPQVEPGDYGLCIYNDLAGTLRIVEYDDDDTWCSHEREDEHKCGDVEDPNFGPEDCYLDTGAIVCDSEGTFTVPYGTLRRFEASFPANSYVSSAGGWVYAVAIVPELDIGRLKIGYTSKPIGQRLSAYRTANPTALLVGLWEADAAQEATAHRAAAGRIGETEVFRCPDVFETLRAIDRVFAQPRPTP